MTLAFVDTISTALFGTTGSDYLVGIMLVAIFIIGFIIIGLPFKYALMFTSPILLAGSSFGFPQIIVTLTWVMIAGWGIYLLWSTLSDR